ncbi:hypothetical protein AB1Y20_008905 [Prymnesium parvum]|uniref:Calcineurin-like phosphoesterase domain-containing protein n=1 Tax=Prymnesium parvum TaxID=97485 RepID=A0AB34K3I5_PRYPA
MPIGATIHSLLQEAEMPHLEAALGALEVYELDAAYRSGRPSLLALLKAQGLSLPESQKFANAFGKATRAAEADEPAPRRASVTTRLYAVSDLHWDHPENRAWLEKLQPLAHADDAIILAGDISHRPSVIEECLRGFKARFAHVFFCPGNHELWVKRDDAHVAAAGRFETSLDKLRWLLDLCASLGVHTQPLKLAGGVWVVPLLSWYQSNLDGLATAQSLKHAEEVVSDAHLCAWPLGCSSDSIADELAQRNQKALARAYDGPVVSFSHFLPRADLMPPRQNMGARGFLLDVSGCRSLETQLRQLGSRLHVFGHTHINWDAHIDGTHYIQNAVRYPRDRTEWASSVDKVLSGDISRLQIWSSDLPDTFCPLPERCNCAVGLSHRSGAIAARTPLFPNWAPEAS